MNDPLATNDRAGLDRGIRRWLTVAAVTFVMGQVERLFHHTGETFGTLLLSPGCVLPFLFWWGARYWSAAFCGAVATLLLLPGIREGAKQYSAISIPVLSAGFALELVIMVWLLRAWGVRQDLSRGRDALFLMLAALVGTSVSGWGVFPILYGPEGLPLATLFKTCATWWLMLFVSIVVFTPGCLTWRRWLSTTGSESLFLTALLVGLWLLESIGLRLWNSHELIASPLFYVSLPLVLWGVLRYGLRAAAIVMITTACLSAYSTAHDGGPFSQTDSLLANLHLNMFLLSIGVTINLIGCFSEESQASLERLKVEHDLLLKAEEIAGVGSWQYDAVTLEEKWSQQFYRQLGLLPDEIPPDINAFRERFVVPEDQARMMQSWHSFLRTGQPDHIEIRIRRGDQRERVMLAQGDMQRDARGKLLRFVGTLRDVTERKLALEDRQRMQDLLNKAEELAKHGSWEMDGNGYMPRWSENMYRICGVDKKSFDRRFETFLSNVCHPEDQDYLRKSFQDFAQGAGSAPNEFRIVRIDGAVVDVRFDVQVARRENGQLVRCYGTLTDITEQKQSERRLKEGEQRYRMLADHAGDLICRIRDDGTFAYASPACRKILDYDPEELSDERMEVIVAPDDRDYCRQMMQRLFRGEDQLTIPFRGLRKDSSIVWLEGKSQRLTADAGRCEILCVIRDVTERRALEVQVAQAQRLEAIGRLAGGIAHDFNNILTVINGYAEILETRFTADDQESKFVSNILEAGRRAAVLTRQLLTYSRKQLVTHGPVNLNELLHKLEPLLKPLMGENSELVLELDPELHLIEGSAGQFEQVIMNLAINACDAMPKGGRLTLGTCNCRVEAAGTLVGRLTPGPYAKLIVADTGQGMSESVKSRMFEPFFTTKLAGEGTGLGLATVYATVEQARGHISVESQPGDGTRIEILFPAQAVSAEVPLPAPPRKRSVTAVGNRRILVVDDDPHIRSLVEMTLNLANYQVVTASDGDEALKLVEAGPQPFDLLLTDVVMKGVNGRELADSLRACHPQLPVIFMSGHTDDAVLRSGVLHNEVTFLQKPFTAEELTSKVQQVLAKQAA